MRKFTKVLGAAAALVILSGTVMADGHLDGAVKARKALMQLYAFNIGQLGGMAKGKIPYDAKMASVAANNLKTAASIDQSAMWPPGSDNGAMGDKTRALPDLWTTFPKVLDAQKALVAATEGMVAAAGKDLASLQAAIGAVGKGCGGCHKPFRVEKK